MTRPEKADGQQDDAHTAELGRPFRAAEVLSDLGL